LEWMQNNEVSHLGIDPRRFVSFGVIKVYWSRRLSHDITDHLLRDSFVGFTVGRFFSPRSQFKQPHPKELSELHRQSQSTLIQPLEGMAKASPMLPMSVS
jgi:hypothetical protein